MNKPEKTFRIGYCSASVFLNEMNNERQFRTVSLQRRYKDGDDWKSSSSFSLADLPHAMAVLQMAMNYLAPLEADTTP
jgi:hypothetical protein